MHECQEDYIDCPRDGPTAVIPAVYMVLPAVGRFGWSRVPVYSFQELTIPSLSD